MDGAGDAFLEIYLFVDVEDQKLIQGEDWLVDSLFLVEGLEGCV